MLSVIIETPCAAYPLEPFSESLSSGHGRMFPLCPMYTQPADATVTASATIVTRLIDKMQTTQ